MINYFFDMLDWSVIVNGILAITTIIFLYKGFKEISMWKNEKYFSYLLDSICLLTEIKQCICGRMAEPMGIKTHELHLLNVRLEFLTKGRISLDDIRDIHQYSNILNCYNFKQLHGNIGDEYLNKDFEVIKKCEDYELKLKKELSLI